MSAGLGNIVTDKFRHEFGFLGDGYRYVLNSRCAQHQFGAALGRSGVGLDGDLHTALLHDGRHPARLGTVVNHIGAVRREVLGLHGQHFGIGAAREAEIGGFGSQLGLILLVVVVTGRKGESHRTDGQQHRCTHKNVFHRKRSI